MSKQCQMHPQGRSDDMNRINVNRINVNGTNVNRISGAKFGFVPVLAALGALVMLLCAAPALAKKKTPKPDARKVKASKPTPTGRQVFLSSGCVACHSIAKKRVAKSTPKIVKGGPDLSAVGKSWKARRLRAWLQQALSRKGAKHPIKFAGSRTQLDALVSWLRSPR
jgi:mono/diheme cytochrome c family protein